MVEALGSTWGLKKKVMKTQTKTQKAIDKYNEGDFKGALAIFKTFKINIPEEEKRALQIAHESLCGKSSFYQMLGIDTDQMIEDARAYIIERYQLQPEVA